jgi:VanZ family protein
MILVLWMIEIFALSQIPGTSVRYYDPLYFLERKIAHVIEYFVLALLTYRTCVSFEVKYRKALLVTFFLSLLWALIDEFHQMFIFGREGKLLDVGIDSIGALLFFGILLAWRSYSRMNFKI